MFTTVVCPYCTALLTVVDDRPSRCRACFAPVIGRNYAGRPALRLVRARPTASESAPATRHSAPPTYQAAS
jgi:hypothetical protein